MQETVEENVQINTEPESADTADAAPAQNIQEAQIGTEEGCAKEAEDTAPDKEAEGGIEEAAQDGADKVEKSEDNKPENIYADCSKQYGKHGFRYGVYRFLKRGFDIFSSGLFILLFSWLYIILAIVVKCSDGGSVFYKHPRMGKNGKQIKIPKFRSMKKNADKLEEMLTPEQLEQYKREYKIDNDPRITKVGGFLRKTSLDELPNIFSIFKGDISVIGPRPLMKSEIEEKYGEDGKKLLAVKPGMIGWWAANGRSNTTYESGERQKLELYYVDHCSIGLDIKIIFKTIIGVFKRTGAK